MDGARFDYLTRSLARGTTRRGVLKGLAAGLLGGLSGSRAVDAARRTARQPNGAACTRAFECDSFHCVDGVCCDTDCTGQCEACTARGVCTPVTSAPVGSRPACPGSGPCAATCDGVTTSHCAGFAGADVPCGAATCADGRQTTSACGGNGSCIPTTTACGLSTCDAAGRGCRTGCDVDADCVAGAHCDGNACLPDEGLGTPCDEDSDCQHGHCAPTADGSRVCCNSSCAGACEACGANGVCGPAPNGQTCDEAGGNTCCGGACIDQHTDLAHCGACDNTCPLTPTAACDDEPICEAGVCAFTPRSGTDCPAACVDDDTLQEAGTCTDAGTCAGRIVSCVAYACRDGACVTTCDGNEDCVPVSQGTCPTGADICTDELPGTTCNDPSGGPNICFCETTVSGATACTDFRQCFDCATDADCEAVTGPGSVCVPRDACDVCQDTNSRACSAPCPLPIPVPH